MLDKTTLESKDARGNFLEFKEASGNWINWTFN